MEALLVLILPVAVAFCVHAAYKLGVGQGEYNASRKYSRQVDEFHIQIHKLHDEIHTLRLDNHQLTRLKGTKND